MRAGRQGRGRGRQGGGGLVALFAVAGLVILVATFAVGVLVGQYWGRSTAFLAGREGRAEGPGARPARIRRLGERPEEDAAPEIQDKLTFYQTLTAPLTNGPPPPPRQPAGEAPKPPVAAPAVTPAARGDGALLYTVQMAAFKSRGQADKLREMLGGEAYVAEVGAGAPAPFRVRVGAFAARAEAEAAAARLRAEHSLPGFVTRR